MRALKSARVSADFSKLWTASVVSNVGDGITMAAGPLLVASLYPFRPVIDQADCGGGIQGLPARASLRASSG